ncbi:MAG: ATP-binding protein [Bdellovibrionota bacterium]
MKTIVLPFVRDLEKRLQESDPLIQVVVGPRQVGKTTGVQLLLSAHEKTFHYVSADGVIAKDPAWITEQWVLAQSKGSETLLVIDEIQKVENWSEAIKNLWDKQVSHKKKLKVILLGSSSLSIQKGLTESLAGRYFLHRVWHWSPRESQDAYNLSFDQYLCFGGYPGSYRFISEPHLWLRYVRDSIIDSVIGRDILSLVRVKSPALFKQCFDLACANATQEISYNKLLGQLQDRGNIELIKNYLAHLEAAFLIKTLHKFSSTPLTRKASSPKILPLCPALYSVTLDAHLDQEQIGRAFELYVGTSLLRKPGQLFYWRERNHEVDYVYTHQKEIIALEVKSGRVRRTSGLHEFSKKFPHAQLKIITKENALDELEKL